MVRGDHHRVFPGAPHPEPRLPRDEALVGHERARHLAGALPGALARTLVAGWEHTNEVEVGVGTARRCRPERARSTRRATRRGQIATSITLSEGGGGAFRVAAVHGGVSIRAACGRGVFFSGTHATTMEALSAPTAPMARTRSSIVVFSLYKPRANGQASASRCLRSVRAEHRTIRSRTNRSHRPISRHQRLEARSLSPEVADANRDHCRWACDGRVWGNEAPKAPAPPPSRQPDGGCVRRHAPPARIDTPAITVAPFKLIPTAKPDRAVDVKADGTAFVGGKMTMKFVDNELRAPEGQTILSLARTAP